MMLMIMLGQEDWSLYVETSARRRESTCPQTFHANQILSVCWREKNAKKIAKLAYDQKFLDKKLWVGSSTF